MKSAACVCLLVLVVTGCQPSRFIAGLNRHKDPLDRTGFDDDDRWPDRDQRRGDRSDDRPQRSRRRGNESRIAKLILEGKSYLNSKTASRRDIEAARRRFEAVLDIDRNNGTAHHHLAMIADRQARFRDAVRHYDIALKNSPRSAALLCNVGYSYYLQKRYDKSEKYLLDAHQLNPRHERTLNNLGALYSKIGDTRKAREYFGLAGASNREIEELIARLNPAATSSGVQTVGGTARDDRNSRLGAPRPHTSGPDDYKNMTTDELRRLMAIQARRGRTERQRRSRPDRSSGGIGGRDPWRGDDQRGASGTQHSNQGVDRYDHHLPGGRSTRRDDTGIRRADWDRNDPGANQMWRDPNGYRAARHGDGRSDIGIGSGSRSQDHGPSGSGTYAPPPSGTSRSQSDGNYSGDRHLWPNNDGDGNRHGSMKSHGDYGTTARLPAAGSNDPYRGGVSDIERKALRTAHNVGGGPVFDLPTQGNDNRRTANRTGDNARSAVYYKDYRSGVRSADYERNRRYDRSSHGSDRRPRYTEFRRGSETRAMRGDNTGYDDRSNERRDPSVPEIKFYPRNTGVGR